MTLSYDNETFSDYEAQIAYALKLYVKPSDIYTLSDETIGHIIGFMRGGLGSRPVLCHTLLSTLPQSLHAPHRAIHEAVINDEARWQPRAREAYRTWMDGCSKIVQRYVILFYLQPVFAAC